jgi:manganese/zinc/iron transport system permease protein
MFDFWIIITACIIAVNCGLLGSFLVLRKLSLLGDALSHAVLPGIVIAFLITEEVNSFWMLMGASVFGILAMLLIEWLNRIGGFGKESAIGIIYTLLFAIGVILITSQAENADIDVDCVLFGDINTTPLLSTVFGIPAPTFNLIVITLINCTVVLFGLKGFKIAAFDSKYAKTLGINVIFWNYLLLGLTSITTVYSFDSVGAIMVIGLLVMPASFANIVTRKIKSFLLIAIAFGTANCVIGYYLALSLQVSAVATIGTLMGLETILTIIGKRIAKKQKKHQETV